MNSEIKIREIIARGYITPSKLPGYDYVINPYIGCPHRCIYCYAEFMKHFTNHAETWGTFIDVKTHSTAVKPVNLNGKEVFLSSVTDCYNPLEEKYSLTRKLLKQLANSGANITILTKSALVIRDIDLFKHMNNITVGISLNTTDEKFLRRIEPEAASSHERLKALKTLHANGIRTWVHVAPIFPYLSDWKSVLEVAQSFTDIFSFENLKLRAAGLPRILLFITKNYPHLKAAYEQIYRLEDMTYWRSLRKEILAYCNEHSLAAAVHFKEKGSNSF